MSRRTPCLISGAQFTIPPCRGPSFGCSYQERGSAGLQGKMRRDASTVAHTRNTHQPNFNSRTATLLPFAMFSPPTPASSPLAHLGSKSTLINKHELFHPAQSSPLSGPSSPTSTTIARRKRQYKSHGSSRSAVAPLNLLGVLEDTPQKQFLRDRFRARCLEQAKEGRGRAVRNRRKSNSGDGSSSDGFDIDSDFAMEEENEDNLDDEVRPTYLTLRKLSLDYSSTVA